MDTSYKAVFTFVPEMNSLDDLDKWIMQAEYVHIYNKFCDVSDPLIPQINSEFDDSSEDDYEEYFASRMKEIIDDVVKHEPHIPGIKYYPKVISGQYVGIVSKFKDAEMFLKIAPM